MNQSGDSATWEQARGSFPILKRYRYFDSGSFGIPSNATLQSQIDHLRFLTEYGYISPESEEFLHGGHLPAGTEEYLSLRSWQGIEALRKDCARLLGCNQDSIVWCDNTTQAFRTLISYVEWGDRKHVVTTDMEHDSMLNVLEMLAERMGLEVDQVGIRDLIGEPDFTTRMAERLADRTVKDRTRLVLFSHIFFSCGIAVDPVQTVVDAINEQCPGATVVIDGAHALGQIPLHVDDYGCDAYVTGGSKWLLAPPGTGILFLGHRESKLIWPTDAFQAIPPAIWRDRRRRLDYMNGDTPPVLGASPYPLIGLNAALQQYRSRDPVEVWKRIRELRQTTASKLSKLRDVRVLPIEGSLTGLIMLSNESWTSRQAEQLASKLSGRGSIVRAMKSPPALRVSVHYFNNEVDADQLVEDIRTLL